MKWLYLFSLFAIVECFFHPGKKSSLFRLHSLKKPNNKSLEDMDIFEKYEKYSQEQDYTNAQLYLLKISNYLKTNQGLYDEPRVLLMDWSNLINTMDRLQLENNFHNISLSPDSEEEIEEDSFEGFLRNEFNKITNNKLLEFDDFFTWRTKMGIILTKEEVKNIFDTIAVEKNECTLMEFITINKVIDENNAPTIDYL
tara:strand:- start:2068 stop:2661 length:594 start_codon:yes stop_codon:yes gene_type:complete